MKMLWQLRYPLLAFVATMVLFAVVHYRVETTRSAPASEVHRAIMNIDTVADQMDSLLVLSKRIDSTISHITRQLMTTRHATDSVRR